jgi:hypothetical protein
MEVRTLCRTITCPQIKVKAICNKFINYVLSMQRFGNSTLRYKVGKCRIKERQNKMDYRVSLL